jgi:hypothetical protein
VALVSLAAAAGYANVTAYCIGYIAHVEAKVEAEDPYELDIAVRDADWSGVVRHVAMEFLDGPRRGERVLFDKEAIVDMPV